MFVYSVKKRQVKMALLVFFVALLAVALIIVSHHTAEAGKTAALNIGAGFLRRQNSVSFAVRLERKRRSG